MLVILETDSKEFTIEPVVAEPLETPYISGVMTFTQGVKQMSDTEFDALLEDQCQTLASQFRRIRSKGWK